MLSLRRLPPSPQTAPSRPRAAIDPQVRVLRLDEAFDSAMGAALVLVWLATALGVCFATDAARIEVFGLLASTTLLGAAMLLAAHFAPWRVASIRRLGASEIMLTAGAALAGCLWGAMPVLLFADATDAQRLVIVGVLAVAVANVYRFTPIQGVGIAYLAPICVGGLIGLALAGTAASFALALATPCLGIACLAHCRRLCAQATRRLADGLRVREQSETIHELLLDFDENECDWLWRTDAEGRVAHPDEGVESLITGGIGDIADAPLAKVLSSRKDARPSNGARAVLAAVAARKAFRNQLVEIAQRDGASHWWRLSGKPMFDAAGRFSGYRGVGSDMTGARNSESRIAYLADFDALTGFSNRTCFQTFAVRQCASAAADGHCRALLCLDLDGFKSVNDSLGHAGGDELLKEVAARLTALAPADTFIARLGGDEFALWLQATTPAKVEAVARRLVEGLAAPFLIDEVNVEIGASVGIALTPKHSVDADDLLVKADLALYRAKLDGKGQACMFVEALETSQIERRKLEQDLKFALTRGEFELYYQPLVDAAEGRVTCFEALIRWKSPDRGFVSPADFIPAAEAAGLIVAIGRWVLFTACREAAGWPDDVRVAVNVSPPQVRAANFLQDVTMALKTSGLHPTRLEIEVTEGVFLDKSAAAMAALRTLRDRGIGVALDDFGTGYSSLNYLIDFPVAKIKIDRSFVTDLPNSETVQAVVDAMLALAKKLAIRVVAEGVETKEQALALKRRRCDMLQGYLFSRPRPASDVPEMIATVPAIFRDAIPRTVESPLAMALATRKQAG